MDGLTLFGFVSVSLMLLTYALEDRSSWFVLAFAGSCAMSSIYGFLRGRGRSGSSKGSGRLSPSAGGR